MTRVTWGTCLHKNSVPRVLSTPALGLYTCIKTWTIMYKIRLQRDFFETYNKWAKLQGFSVDIRFARLNKVHGELLYYPRHQRWRRRPQIFYVKVFRTSLFPNPLMDLVYIWYDGYWSKILFSTIPTPMHDLRVKVTDFYVNILR